MFLKTRQSTLSLENHITFSGKISISLLPFHCVISSTIFFFQKWLCCLLCRISTLAKLRHMEFGLEVKTMEMHSMATLTMVPLTTSTTKICIKAQVIFSCRPLLFKSFLNLHTSAPWDVHWKWSTSTLSWKKGAIHHMHR